VAHTIHNRSCFMLEPAEIDVTLTPSVTYGLLMLVIQSHGSSSFPFYRFGCSYKCEKHKSTSLSAIQV